MTADNHEPIPQHLKRLGLDTWFWRRLDPARRDAFSPARVMAVDKERYLICSHAQDIPAEITGKLMFTAASPLDYPTVGDWVYAQFLDDNTFAIIEAVIARKNVLRRKTAGKRVEFQLVAANIDKALILQALDADFNLRRLERYLVMVNESRIEPVVLLSKSDLATPDEHRARQAQIRALMPDLAVAVFSNLDPDSLGVVHDLTRAGETFCLLGSSGVGKTTLLNNLLGTDQFETRSIRAKDGKGRHTTTRRQLTLLANGAMLIDTPGMRELGLFDADAGIQETFSEIQDLAGRCRFNDCTHQHEAGCAVLAAVDGGTLAPDRYQNYLKMSKEARYYEKSYLEKKRTEKKFGKMCKAIMQSKKQRW